MADDKRIKQKEKRKINWKLPTKKNEYSYGNNNSRIYSEKFRKLHMNQLREFLVNNSTSN